MRLKRHGRAVARDFGRGGGERQSAGLQEDGARNGSAASERAHASQQHVEGKRLHQIIVRAEIEAFDHVLIRVARGQHQDRRLVLAQAQTPRHFEAVDAGQHQVEQDYVERSGDGEIESIASIVRDGDGVGLLAERLAQQLGHAALIFYDQNLHNRIPHCSGRI